MAAVTAAAVDDVLTGTAGALADGAVGLEEGCLPQLAERGGRAGGLVGRSR
jgi:hypothetical protein